MTSIHDPVTLTMARYLVGDGRTRAKGGYVCYAPGCPGNAWAYHAGFGQTEKAALEAARYWANQAAFVRVIPASKAPQWAIDEATAAAEAQDDLSWSEAQ